ncbi:MAG: DUF262 domain-containing protein [Acidobacteria bacterium]|nr:DUF262 domain-containing protein [Acidobacteriota bacterium]
MSERVEAMFERPRSAEELVGLYDQLSVPHFQRGLVWDTRSIALLLESLFQNTPCGAVILWAAPDADQQGVALGRSPRFLIVDGQQRIRSLYGVLKGDEGSRDDPWFEDEAEAQDTGGDGPAGGAPHDRRVWCLNLGQVRELQDRFPGGRRYRLFRRARDPRRDRSNAGLHGAPLRDMEALLPLNWFLTCDDAQILELVGFDGNRALEKAARAVLDHPDVKSRLRQMLKRPAFQVSVIGPERSLPEVVGIYNRINSSGKRVEAEERAFAGLVSAYHDAPSHLTEFFDSVHPRSMDTNPDPRDLKRDGLLRRQKEGRYGFKLFMRAFAIVLAYHSSRSIGSSSFSFEALTPDLLAKAEKHLTSMLDETVRVLERTADVLRRVMRCDDFRMLPDTESLWPVFQLFTRFPGIDGSLDGRLGSIVLRLVLGRMQKKDVLRLCADISRTQGLNG